MTHYLGCKHRVDAISRVQNEITPKECHHGVEDEKHRQAERYGKQCSVRMVYDDLIDNRLRKKRCREANHLDPERSQEDVAPGPTIAGERWNEPAKSEAPRFLVEPSDQFTCAFWRAAGVIPLNAIGRACCLRQRHHPFPPSLQVDCAGGNLRRDDLLVQRFGARDSYRAPAFRNGENFAWIDA